MENGLYHREVYWTDDVQKQIDVALNSGLQLQFSNHAIDKEFIRQIPTSSITIDKLKNGECFEVLMENKKINYKQPRKYKFYYKVILQWSNIIKEKGIDISNVYTDCGIEIFDLEEQDVHCGGSGCGCSATVFAGYIYQKLLNKEFNKVMLVSTGALLSPTSTLQKQTIPCVAHAVVIENDQE